MIDVIRIPDHFVDRGIQWLAIQWVSELIKSPVTVIFFPMYDFKSIGEERIFAVWEITDLSPSYSSTYWLYL